MSGVGPTAFDCWIFFSGIRRYVLHVLNPYFCFVSFLYVDLNVLGDDTSVGLGLSCDLGICFTYPIQK